MKSTSKIAIAIKALVAIALVVGYGGVAVAEDAFSILGQLEKNYVGLEKPGLETLTAKAKFSVFPEAIVTIYWARGKGLKTKIEGGGPAAMTVEPMVKGFVSAAGLGIKKASEESNLTKENVTGTFKSATLKDGTKVTELTFIPKEGKEVGFTKMTMMVDPKEWVVRETRTTTKQGETVAEMTYKGGLLTKIVSATAEVTSTITNTYTTVDKFTVPAKTEVTMEGKNIQQEMKQIAVTYSDIKINAKIPDEIFAEPKPGEVPKPTETAAVLFQQAQESMLKGDLETAKLKLRQIITYYPDDQMTPTAKMMLNQLPK